MQEYQEEGKIFPSFFSTFCTSQILDKASCWEEVLMGGWTAWWPAWLSVHLLQESGSTHRAYLRRRKKVGIWTKLSINSLGRKFYVASFLDCIIQKKKNGGSSYSSRRHHSKSLSSIYGYGCLCFKSTFGFSKLVQVCLFSDVRISSRSVFKHQAIEGLLFLEFIFLFNPLIRSGEMSRLSTQHKRKPQWSSKEKIQNNRQITMGYIVQLLLSLKCAKLETGERFVIFHWNILSLL